MREDHEHVADIGIPLRPDSGEAIHELIACAPRARWVRSFGAIGRHRAG
jgi:hypothetical protein